MSTVESSITYDDSFNKFVHDRSSKATAHQCSTPPPADQMRDTDKTNRTWKEQMLTADTDDFMLRSDGSGSENGAEGHKSERDWYGAELREKVSRCLPPQPVKRMGGTWQRDRMESFESNKEVVGSEGRASPLSGFSPAHKADGSSDYPTCSSRGPADFEEDDWEGWERPTGERWPPLGAPNDEDEQSICSFEELGRSRSEVGRLRELEEEQEQLNSSLMSLTSHFAQVQFRLKQIINAEAGEKEALLKELEEFADRGIPDLRAIEHTRQAVRQCSTSLKQDQLKGKLPLDVENLGQLSVEDLRRQVDACVKQLINPLKMKEQLVSQLQTQIGDLERFIDFLQDDDQRKVPPGLLSPSKCQCGGHGDQLTPKKTNAPRRPKSSSTPNTSKEKQQQLHDDTARLMDRATLLLDMLRFTQLGCGPSPPRTHTSSAKGHHWGDLRANLELAIATLAEEVSASFASSDYTSDSDVGGEEPMGDLRGGDVARRCSSQQVTLTVRKLFVPALRDLLHHGLMPTSSGRSLVSAWSCFPTRSPPSQLLHAWDVVMQYYHLKRGHHYNTTPARRLSQSFNLELRSGGSGGLGAAGGHKGALLATVGNILSTHTPLKRSHDSHFKAFVSEALNQQRLVVWLRLLLRCQPLVQKCYQPWSYVVQTGFEDAFKSLETLQQYQFNLPADLAVRSLRNINDAF
ncbi:RUN domain-containing protein 1 [Hyalella azteca]|uniref:RUN domain-containing protein 1 n=1 Tax=Hyalella azteca TaxID=294128 RepID=A0A8B7PIN8_HYAAZ|nr:RUN domain-containing protein 1 [Hyalella azteca]